MSYSTTQRRNDKLAFRAAVSSLVSLVVKLEEYRKGSNFLNREEVESLEEEIYSRARYMARMLSRIQSPDGREASGEVIEEETDKILTNASKAAHAILANREERLASEEVRYRDIEGVSDEENSDTEDRKIYSRQAPQSRLSKQLRLTTRGRSKGMQQPRDLRTGRFVRNTYR